VEISYQTTFVPDEIGGEQVWSAFSKDGRLPNSDFKWISSGETLAGAIAVRFTLQPHEKRVVPMVISWDLPLMEFGTGRRWHRHYTDFFGTSGKNALKVAAEGLTHASEWSDAIDAWQAPYVNDASKPEWYRAELFNELYALTDGGSLWGRPVGADPKSPPLFSFLECYDYPYYSTLDVRFYGSMPLIKFWPELDKQEMRTFAETVLRRRAGKTHLELEDRAGPQGGISNPQEPGSGSPRPGRAGRGSVFQSEPVQLAEYRRLERSEYEIRIDGLSRLRLHRTQRHQIPARHLAVRATGAGVSPQIRSRWRRHPAE
jgi:hypothetical protein